MECKIVLFWTYRNHLNELRDYKQEFGDIHNFSNYLRWEPDRANQLGYGNRQLTFNSRNSNVRMSIVYDGIETPFVNVTEFVQFLKVNPEVAKAIQFIGKM